MRKPRPGASRLQERVSPTTLLLFLLVLLLASAVLSVVLGSTRLSLSAVISDPGGTERRIFTYIRLPRTLAACLAGAALAVSGVILQTVLNNSLAGPNIIGVNAGAGFAMLLFVAFFPTKWTLFPLAAFAGGFACSLLIYLIARLTGASRTTIILAGVAVNSLVNAASNIIKTLDPDILAYYNDFSVGSLNNVTMQQLIPAGIVIGMALLVTMLLGHDINILSLGEELAKSLGLRVGLYRLALIALSSALAGAAVSFGGLISFVGLLVPHIGRAFVGNDARLLVPVSALTGACAVMLCDTFARTAFAPFELPVGIILSFVGGAFFIYLLISRKGGRVHD